MLMGMDQYGNYFHDIPDVGITKHLKEKFGLTGRVSRMFCDGKNGETFHVGYVIGNHWVTLLRVEPWQKKL